MTDIAEMTEKAADVAPATPGDARTGRGAIVTGVLLAAPLVAMYAHTAAHLYDGWTSPGSYYSHGFLVPLICGFLAWQKREELKRLPLQPSKSGFAFVIVACFLLLAGDFLGFRVLGELSLLPLAAGLVLLTCGPRHLALLWFPIVFLIFMIPIPQTMTQSIVLKVKLVATEGAVRLAHVFALPMVRDGSFVHFGNDKLLVGEVCGGLRSLISLLAIGALTSYLSKTRTWAKWAILLVSPLIAVVSNILRIFVLCVVGYFWGSEVAVGRVHDASGILIFVVAFGLLFGLEALLRRFAAAPSEEGASR